MGGLIATFRKRSGPRGATVWQAQIIRRGHERHYKTFDTKAEAEARARQIEGEMDRGVFMSRAEAENTTLREALARYAVEISAKKRSGNRESYISVAGNLQASRPAPWPLSERKT